MTGATRAQEEPALAPEAAAAAARRGRHTSPVRVVRRPAAVAALLIGLLVAAAGVTGLVLASHTGRPALTPSARPPALVPIPTGKWAAVPPSAARAVARPVRLVIPEIGVRTRLVHLGITPAGTLQVPGSTAVAGWYTGSPRPGQPGGAVIAGHIDSVQGPGVFYRLRELRRGQHVYVRRADRSLAVFRVTLVRTYPKTGFPTAAVYGPTPDAQLRLITCGGVFDPVTGHYLSNTIVYASLVP
jgi:sortase (surface protein transpeptidase)